MGRIDYKYYKLLTKALFRKMRVQRCLLYVVLALTFLMDIVTMIMSERGALIDYNSSSPYTIIAFVICCGFILWNMMGRNIFSNLSFIPSTKKTEHAALITNQIIFIIIGEVAGLLVYFLQYGMQKIVLNLPKSVNTYMAVPFSVLKIGKGLLFFILIGTAYVLVIALLRYLICHFSKVMMGIFAFLIINIIYCSNADAIHDPFYILLWLGKFFLGIQPYWHVIIKVMILSSIVMVGLILLLKQKEKYCRLSIRMYLINCCLLAACGVFIFAGVERQERFVKWNFDNVSMEHISNMRLSKEILVKDASEFNQKLNVRITNISNETQVLLNKYKANANGNNPVKVELKYHSIIDTPGISANKIDVTKQVVNKDEIQLRMNFDRIKLVGVESFSYIGRYIGGDYYSYGFNNHSTDCFIVITYPDSIKLDDVMALDTDKIDYGSYNYKEYKDVVDDCSEK
ncbi:hypothetical protein lbkm_2626 [Lachnospiraceae bacterium KM106-2]|nr:hypothetical protein lbkm_2626 [Lachnospiraceae bacterium KM106-2]